MRDALARDYIKYHHWQEKQITNNNYYRNRTKIKLIAHYERALKSLITNISKSITEFPVMKWGKTTSKLQCRKRGKYHKRTSKCVSHVLPCNLLTPWQSKIQMRGTSRLNWHLLDCHTSHTRLFVIPTSIPTHTMSTIHSRLLILFLWDYVCAPSDTHLLLEIDHISKRLKTMDNSHNKSHIYCNRLLPETYIHGSWTKWHFYVKLQLLHNKWKFHNNLLITVQSTIQMCNLLTVWTTK